MTKKTKLDTYRVPALYSQNELSAFNKGFDLGRGLEPSKPIAPKITGWNTFEYLMDLFVSGCAGYGFFFIVQSLYPSWPILFWLFWSLILSGEIAVQFFILRRNAEKSGGTS